MKTNKEYIIECPHWKIIFEIEDTSQTPEYIPKVKLTQIYKNSKVKFTLPETTITSLIKAKFLWNSCMNEGGANYVDGYKRVQ